MDTSKTSSASAPVSRRGFLRTAVAGPAVGMAAAQSVALPVQPVYLADMSLCQPASALSRIPHPRQWRLIEYEAEAFHGKMIVAGENTDAPELRMPLGHSGWHSIFVGIYPFHVDHIFQYDRDEADDEFRVELRLSGESTGTLLTHRGSPRGRIDEFFWKNADITGHDLVLRQFQKQLFPETASASGRVGSSCWIAYIKLVPLSEEHVRAEKRKHENTATGVSMRTATASTITITCGRPAKPTFGANWSLTAIPTSAAFIGKPLMAKSATIRPRLAARIAANGLTIITPLASG